MDEKTAKATVEALCDLLEIGPLRMMDARNDARLKELARNLESQGRPVAAERLRMGWEVIKKKFHEGMQAGMRSLQGQPPAKPPNGPTATHTKAFVTVPACVKCMAPIRDQAAHQGTVEGLLCPKCREMLDGPALIRVIEAELANRQRAMDRMTFVMGILKERLAVLGVPPK